MRQMRRGQWVSRARPRATEENWNADARDKRLERIEVLLTQGPPAGQELEPSSASFYRCINGMRNS